MKCEIVIQNINQYFCKGLAELDAETRQHLTSCRDCNLHFTNQKSVGDVVKRIADFEPVLKDPAGLTDDIMMGLPDTERAPEPIKTHTPLSIFKSINFSRAMSAAAIILFALFGYEQFVVLDKINRLETQFQNVSEKKSGDKNMRTYKAWEIRAIKNFSSIKTNNKGLLDKINSVANNI